MGYDNQLGQKNIENSMQRGFDFNNRSIERGFSALGFQLQQDKCGIIHSLPYEKAAKALMGASGYVAYVAKHGYHFTGQLAIKASGQMKNADGTGHRWKVDGIRLATNNGIISESDRVQYAIAVASYPDGYEGMAFCRWTADIIGKGVTIDWEKLE